jgi:hypothetical protein
VWALPIGPLLGSAYLLVSGEMPSTHDASDGFGRTQCSHRVNVTLQPELYVYHELCQTFGDMFRWCWIVIEQHRHRSDLPYVSSSFGAALVADAIFRSWDLGAGRDLWSSKSHVQDLGEARNVLGKQADCIPPGS